MRRHQMLCNFGVNTGPPVAYANKIVSTFGASLIAYWPLWELTGTVADNYEGTAARDGTYVGQTLGQTGIGDGRTAPYWDGANDYLTLPAALTAVFNRLEGTLVGWIIADAACWPDATARAIVHLGQDASNRLLIYKSAANTLRFTMRANNVALLDRTAATSATTPLHFAVTWSASGGISRAFLAGVQLGANAVWNNTYVGGISTYRSLGSDSASAASAVWLGKIAHVALANAALTPTQIAQLATV